MFFFEISSSNHNANRILTMKMIQLALARTCVGTSVTGKSRSAKGHVPICLLWTWLERSPESRLLRRARSRMVIFWFNPASSSNILLSVLELITTSLISFSPARAKSCTNSSISGKPKLILPDYVYYGFRARSLQITATRIMTTAAVTASIMKSWVYSSLQFAVTVFWPFITTVAEVEVDVKSPLHPAKTFWTRKP